MIMNINTFKNWATQFVQWEKDKGQEIKHIDFNAIVTVRYNPKTGLISLNPDSYGKGKAVVTGIEKAE